MDISSIIEKCIESGKLTREEIIFLLSLKDKSDIEKLFSAGDIVRRKYCGDDVQIRALLEISNICARHCNYCGIRADNSQITRYRIEPDEIVDIAVALNGKGLKTIVLQSGEDPYYTGAMIADIVKRIKANTDMALTLSIGERTYEEYKLWKEAGADRYLLRHEAANRDLYKKLHPDSDYDHRMQCLKWLREIGYQAGAGCMVGCPGQTLEHLADDIEFIQSFQPDMVGIGPFISHPQTPYADEKSGTVDLTLKMVALARIVTRDALLPATTAIGSIDEIGREKALQAGADVMMPNYTPLKYRVLYEIYPNKRCINEEPEHCSSCMKTRIVSTGRTISDDCGHSRKKMLK